MNKKQLIAFLLLVISIQPSMIFANVADGDCSWETTTGAAAMIGADIKKATGYDWLEYRPEQKLALMAAMFDFFKLDKSKYSIEKGVKLLDVHYRVLDDLIQERPDLDEDKYFSYPCLMAFASCIDEKKVIERLSR